MKDELKDYMGRPKRYDNIDGTGEMSMGVMLMGFALLGYLQAVLPKDSMWKNGFTGFLFMYMILIPVLGLGYLLSRVIKKHITWPRTGYVAYGVDAQRVGGSNAKPRMSVWTARAVVAVVAAVVAAGFACLIMLGIRRHLMSLTRMGYLVFWVPVYAFWVFQMGRLHRWKWLVVLFMALGLLVIGLIGPGDFIEMSRPVILFVGLTWLGSGMATLYLYIRHNRPPAPETE